eukprot:COSAG02_NODE_1624_length_11594_cov_6.314833_1_plen_128_part_00
MYCTPDLSDGEVHTIGSKFGGPEPGRIGIPCEIAWNESSHSILNEFMHAEYGIFVYTIWPLIRAAPRGRSECHAAPIFAAWQCMLCGAMRLAPGRRRAAVSYRSLEGGTAEVKDGLPGGAPSVGPGR